MLALLIAKIDQNLTSFIHVFKPLHKIPINLRKRNAKYSVSLRPCMVPGAFERLTTYCTLIYVLRMNRGGARFKVKGGLAVVGRGLGLVSITIEF